MDPGNGGPKLSLGADNLILKGCLLRNTDYVYGFAVYTGHDSKVMMNSSKPRFKLSQLEQATSKAILIILLTQFILALMAAIIGTIQTKSRDDNVKYLTSNLSNSSSSNDSVGILMVQLTGSWILMLTNFVPISLMLTLELVKFWQGMFMGYDHHMFDPEQDMEMRCQSSNLNEELGQVEYVFSDKTGTLTANIMEFRKFTTGINYYGTDKDGGKDQESNVNFCDDKMY